MNQRGNNVRISIVIPLFNKESSIRRALHSALDQVNVDYTDIEIIIVDDESSDDSLRQARKVMDENPDRQIRILQQKNGGVSSARNLGAAFARYDHIAFLDADDSYAPTFLSQIHQLHQAFPTCHFLATSYEFISVAAGTRRRPKLAHIDQSLTQQKLTDFFASAADGDLPFCASSICISRSMFQTCGGFPEGENMGEDQALYCKVALRQSIAYSPLPQAHYYLDVGGSLMQSENVFNEMPFSKRLQIKLDQHKVPQRLRRSAERYISGHLLDLVRRNLTNGNRAAARALLKDDRSKIKLLKWCYWRSRAL